MEQHSLDFKIRAPFFIVLVLSGLVSLIGAKWIMELDDEASHHYESKLLTLSTKHKLASLQNLMLAHLTNPKLSLDQKNQGFTDKNFQFLDIVEEFKSDTKKLLKRESDGFWFVPSVKNYFFSADIRIDDHLNHLSKLLLKIEGLMSGGKTFDDKKIYNEFKNTFEQYDREIGPIKIALDQNLIKLENYRDYIIYGYLIFISIAFLLVYFLIYLPWIREHKKIEREQNRLQRVLAESELRGNTFSWELNFTTKVTTRSNRLSGIFDTEEQVDSVFLYDEVSLLLPEHQSLFIEAIENCVSKDEVVNIDVCLTSKNKKKYWLNYYGKKVVVGKDILIQGTVREITERVLSQQRFNILFENLHSPALIFGEGQIRQINNSGREFFGINKNEEFDKLHPATLFPLYQKDGESSLERIKLAQEQASEGRVVEDDLVFKTRYGKDRSGSVTLFKIPYSALDLYLLVIMDNRQRYEFERRLVDANRRALHSRRLKLEYVTQMGLVLQDLTELVKEEIILRKDMESGHLEKLEGVKKDLDELWRENLTQGLEEGSHIVLTDVRAIIKSFEKKWLNLALENEHQFKIKFIKDREHVVWIDSTKLRMALITMVENALMFGKGNLVELRIDISFKTGRYGKLTFSVYHDSGEWPSEDWRKIVVSGEEKKVEKGGILSINGLLRVIDVLQGEFFIGYRRGLERSSVGFQCNVEKAMGVTLEEINESQKTHIIRKKNDISASDIFAHFGGDWDIIGATIKDFMDYYPSAIADMHYFLRDKNSNELFNIASDLYGVLAHFPFYVGIERVIKIQKFSKYLKFERIEEEIIALSEDLNDLALGLKDYLPDSSKQKSAS